MKTRIIAVVLVLVLLLFWLLRTDQQEESTTATPSESVADGPKPSNSPQPNVVTPAAEAAAVENLSDEAAKARFLKAFDSPIEFYGRVIDQHGAAVSGASVEFTVTNRPFEDGSKSNDLSDDDGFFYLVSSGAAVSVQVRKNGYYATDQSGGVFRYATASQAPIPTADSPAIFVLRKEGEKQSLRENDVRFRVSRNGNPKYVDLITGNSGSNNDSSVKIEAWTNDGQKDKRGRYDWRVRLSVEGGGLIEREDRYSFVAPETGYMELAEITMPSDSETWSPQASKDYFVRLANGDYARVSFRMIAGGDNFFTLRSWYNLAGSVNLE